MPQTSRIFSSDEELGKKDDDHKLTAAQSWRSPLRWRRRRIFIGLVATFLVWLFIHNIPTDLGSIDERMGRPLRPGRAVDGVQFGYRPPVRGESKPGQGKEQGPGQGQKQAGPGTGQAKAQGPPTGPPPRDGTNTAIEDSHYYSGPIKFYELASSLHGVARTQGHRLSNRNVLFAAASLKSAANLIPMACEMASKDRNFVHFIILGRDALHMDDLLDINGVDQHSCTVDFHDGRADYSEYSSELRAEVSVTGAMSHVHEFMHPQVIITDDSAVEEAYFTRGMRAKAREIDRPIIEIPAGKYEDFLWITRLDSASLASWHKPTISLLVNAPPHSSGSLVRLLDSLQFADYTGFTPPQLTLDLPTEIEPYVKNYLHWMMWPPQSALQVPNHNTINLHHRISPAKTNTETNAMRLLETFYPANTQDSHLLLLSTQTELSPLFYHYLLYHVLEYRYSARVSYGADHLLGIALPAPQAYLNASTPFAAPSVTDMIGRKYAGGRAQDEASGDKQVPFLWQAPNADAALIFGNKWAELHDYLKNRLRAMHNPNLVQRPPTKPAKVISRTQPGWMEYMLELMRARGWTMIYPAAQGAGSWVTVHQDLYKIPEEFARQPRNRRPKTEEAEAAPRVTDEPFLGGDFASPKEPVKEDRATIRHSQPLHAMLPFNGELPELADMPQMSHAGDIMPGYVLDNQVPQYKIDLRQQVGGCDAAHAGIDRLVVAGITDDLFCFVDNEDMEDYNDVVQGFADAIVGDDVQDGGSEPAPIPVVDSAPAQKAVPKAAPGVVPEAPAPEVAPKEPVLDSTAKQKAAYAKALGLVTDDDSALKAAPKAVPETAPKAASEVQDTQEKPGAALKVVVDDLGAAPPIKE